MTEKELIRRALLGNTQAQEKCTEKGVVLPCPCCGGKARLENMGFPHHVYCEKCGLKSTSVKYEKEGEKDAIKKWNTRPAPSIGRCGECEFYTVLRHCKVYSQEPDQYDSGTYVEMLPDDFCSYFEPREE